MAIPPRGVPCSWQRARIPRSTRRSTSCVSGRGTIPTARSFRITHLNIPQARRTHEIILGKSFWSWGAELGCNEHGVAVGNEAAFSNQSEEKDGVVVLDLLRLAVERARNAREAVDVIGHHIETYGQGGNCQMMGNYAFDSGLLVADRNEAYVVNGAGRHWAARRVSGVEAISNRYQVRDDWDLSSLKPENGAKPDFRALFAEEALEASCGASERENAAQRILEERRGRDHREGHGWTSSVTWATRTRTRSATKAGRTRSACMPHRARCANGRPPAP